MTTAQALLGKEEPNPLSGVNSREAIAQRAAAGRIGWSGPLLMITARIVFAFLAQMLVVLLFVWARNPDPMKASTAWWSVTGTLVDLGCLALLLWLTKREGIRLLDIIGIHKQKLGRDFLTGLGIVVIMFPVVMIGGSILASLLIYGKMQPDVPAEVMSKTLPLWAALYSRIIWWPIWSVTEEMTYNGYALPRLQVLLHGRTWLAILLVSLTWAVQHSFLPLILDGKVFLYLFVQMLPLVTVSQLIYLRFRRLPPMIVMHWAMDLFSAIVMITVI